MLLACPNCDARYEVPNDAIPENGRDVQCSNCGHAWFQLPFDADEAGGAAAPEVAISEIVRAEVVSEPALSADPFADTDVAEDDEVAVLDPAEPAPPAPAFSAPEPRPDLSKRPPEELVAAESAAALTGTDALKAALSGGGLAAPAPAPAPEPPPQPVRRELDDAVLAILRDEAEREAEARRSEAQRNTNRRAEAETGLQSQPELSMPPPTPEMTAQQKRLAMLRGEDLDDEPEPEPSRPMARRDLLPDVEEINSTLQPDDSRFDPEAEVDSLPDLTKGSFRTGFLLAMLALIIAALVYIFSQEIVGWVPALEGAMQAYVTFVDNLRNWLNSMMDSATQALTSEASAQN